MVKDDVLELVDALLDRGLWGENIAPGRRCAIQARWVEALGPYASDDVRRVVAFALDSRPQRLDLITLPWITRQCASLMARRAAQARTPLDQCDACLRLGGGQVCDYHRETGLAHIRRLRREFGWHPSQGPQNALAH